MSRIQTNLNDSLRKAALSLDTPPQDYAPLLNLASNKSFVLLGEATHGTHEFYETRVELTKWLIIDHGLSAIAVEGDWPSAYRVNRYVRWLGDDGSPEQALCDFTRFPLWMWRNRVIRDFVGWLREHNHGLPYEQQVGFYGLDMYSLYESVAAVLDYLDKVDPEAADAARQRYGCLDHVSSERHYGYGVTLGRRPSCEDEVVRQLMDIHQKAGRYVEAGDPLAEDEQFQAEQNARLIQSAEAYYRQMFSSRVNTWNLRDTHMSDTLDLLHRHLSRRLGRSAKIAVWEHNSHLGAARATEMGARGEHNVGQLTRERYGDDCCLIGFTTYKGSVTAASEWDGPAERKRVRPGIPGSIEEILSRLNRDRFWLPLRGEIAEALREPRLQRAIGVLYLPDTERASHYFRCRLAEQFDAVLHFEETRALEPLDTTSEWVRGEQETYPFGL